MSYNADLFTPLTLGAYDLKNRIVMAPLTRCRAGADNVPQALNADYYAQRASVGLIVSEATQVAPEGVGYPATPGIHSADQAGYTDYPFLDNHTQDNHTQKEATL